MMRSLLLLLALGIHSSAMIHVGGALTTPSLVSSLGAFRCSTTTKARQKTWTGVHAMTTTKASDSNWTDLMQDGGVQKQVLTTGTNGAAVSSPPLEEGATATISYVGTLADAHWSVEEVVTCWVQEQQGLEDTVADAFRSNHVDEVTLTNLDVFNDGFVQQQIGISAKIACKKLVMAAKRLATTRKEYVAGTEFDANNSYNVVVGPAGTLIPGMKTGIATMAVGDTALFRIRSDYGYGAEGHRKSNGEVVVPPFATLQFQVTVLE